MNKNAADGLEFWLEQAITPLMSVLKARMKTGPRTWINEPGNSCFLLHTLISPRFDQ
jgi:hypothetical protein